MVEASTVCTEDVWKDVLQVIFCVVIHKTVSIHTKLHVTLDTFEHHCLLHAPPWTHATSLFHVIVASAVLIVMCYTLPMLLEAGVVSVQAWMVTALLSKSTLVLAQWSRNFCKVLGGNVSFPYLRTITQLPLSNTKRFYDPNVSFHSLNARLTAQYVFKTYDTYAFKAN